MKDVKNIIFANDTEAFEDIIQAIKNSKKRYSKIAKENFLCGRFLLWESDDKIVITPKPIQKEIIEQIKSFGQKNIENWFPKKIFTNLSQAIYEDKSLFKKLEGTIKKNPGVTLSPYCYTIEFSLLVKRLGEAKLKFRVDQQPIDETSSLVEYLGSKTGFRKELYKIKGIFPFIPMPNFSIHPNADEVRKSVGEFYKINKPCIIKANCGEGGWGVLFVQPEKFAESEKLFTWLQEEFKKDSIWEKGPYLVEEFIDSDNGPEHSPSLEVFIGDKLKPVITYTCNQVVDRQGRFIGVLMGKNCIGASTEKRICEIGNAIGKQYAKLGYRGFFDIDFITSKNGEPYPIETNVRRTGGTHVFDIVHWIFGPQWNKKTVVLSSDSFEYGVNVLSAKDIFRKIQSLRFPMNNQKEGVIIAALASDTPVFSCIIVGSNKKRTFEIYSNLRKIFPNRHETDNA